MKLLKINLCLLFSCCFFAAYFSGCSQNFKNSSHKVVFIAQWNEENEYWNKLNNELKNNIENKGYEFENISSSEWGTKTQNELIKKAADENVHAIILAPISKDVTNLFEGLKEADKKNIPVIFLDCDIDEEFLNSAGIKKFTYIGVDNYEGGRSLTAKMISDLKPGSTAAVLDGSVDAKNGEERCRGAKDSFINSGINVKAQVTTGWEENMAYIYAKEIIEAYPDIKVIFTVNSKVGNGALRAIEESGKDIYIGTFDVDGKIKEYIESGKKIFVIDQNLEQTASKTAEIIENYDKGILPEQNIRIEPKFICSN